MGPGPKPEPLQLKVESALFLQKVEIAKDVLLDLVRLGFGIDFLQVHDDLLDGVLAVAALDNLQAWAVQAQGAFRHQQDFLALVFAKPAAGGELWARIWIDTHNYSILHICQLPRSIRAS